MEPQNKEEGKSRRREEMLARRVGEALDRMDPRGAGYCPDAEVVAAYADQALESAELAQWESHFAGCARCRKILRVLAASADTPLAEKEVARLGELASAPRSPAASAARVPRPGRTSFLDWRLRWLAPALGVAAVFAVWFAMRAPWRTTSRGVSTTLVAQAPKEEPPTSAVLTERLSKVAPEPAQRVDGVPPGKSPRQTALQSEREIPSASPAPLPPPKAKTMEALPASPSEKRVELDAARQPPSAEAKEEAVVNAPSRDKQSPVPQVATDAFSQSEASPRFAASARKSQNATPMGGFETTSILIRAPSGSTLWRIGGRGRIERSVDSGQSWMPQVSPFQEDWLAGAAVSDTVCWVVGRNGAIARTMDGKHWERVAPPDKAAGADGKLPDWTSIIARDAGFVTITERDGRKFATADGGKTWQAQ